MSRHLSPAHYSILAVILHWSLAFALAFQMGLGWHMSDMQDSQNSAVGLFAVTQFHKSVGILILLASIARLLLRIYKKPPTALYDDRWAYRLSQYTHVALYIFMIGTPLSGWLIVSSSNLNIDTYIFETLYWPHIPGIKSLSDASRSSLNMVSLYAHAILSWAGTLLFFLHVAGALRHQYFKDEAILWRILPIIKPLGRMNATICLLFIIVLLMSLFAYVQYNASDLKPNKVVYDVPDTSEAKSSSNIPMPSSSQESVESLIDNEESETAESSKEIEESEDKDQVNIITKLEVSKTETIKPQKWTVIGTKSLEFSVRWNDAIVRGSFSDWSADIKFASSALAQSSIKVVVNLASVTTSDASVNSAIGGADFFNLSASSEAKYMSNRIQSLGDKRYQIDGMLHLKNIEEPLRIIFTLDENGDNARAKGYAQINRLSHNIGEGQNEIDNEVKVDFEFMAKK